MLSIILPVFNAEKYVKEAIESILNQTFKDFELIIIDDGSQDSSRNIIESFVDNRIIKIYNGTNRGLIYTLNKGLSISKKKYVARMDADDISLPNRLEKQISYMETHPDCIVCGTDIMPYKNNRKLWFLKTPYKFNNESIKKHLIRSSCFAHPTVIMRNDILKYYNIQYNADYKHAEDYKLWIDLCHYGRFHNIDEKLLYYRITNTQITHNKSNKETATQSIQKCRKEFVKQILPSNIRLYNLLFEEELSYKTIINIKKIKSKINDKEIINHLCCNVYCDLSQYTLKDFIYYIISFDFIKFDLLTNRHILRCFFKNNSLLSH